VSLVDQNNNSIWDIGAFAYPDTRIDNNPPSLPILVFPANNDSIDGESIEFRWAKSTDADNDTVIYRITYCTDQNLTNCAPVSVPLSTENFLYTGTGVLIFGMTFIGGLSRQKRYSSIYSLLSLLVFAHLMSCEVTHDIGSNVEGIKYDISGLSKGTTYYWKVEADDMRGGVTQSAVWSFSTL
jgi:hypothetical protein